MKIRYCFLVVLLGFTLFFLIRKMQDTETYVLEPNQTLRMSEIKYFVRIISGDANIQFQGTDQHPLITNSGAIPMTRVETLLPGAYMKPYTATLSQEGPDTVWISQGAVDVIISSSQGATIEIPFKPHLSDLLILMGVLIGWSVYILISVLMPEHNTSTTRLGFAMRVFFRIAIFGTVWLWFNAMILPASIRILDGKIWTGTPATVSSGYTRILATVPSNMNAGACSPFVLALTDGTIAESIPQGPVGSCILYYRLARSSQPPGTYRVISGSPTMEIIGTYPGTYIAHIDVQWYVWTASGVFCILIFLIVSFRWR
jgi:hypothetical protein